MQKRQREMKTKSKEGGSGLDELLLLFCYFLLTPGNASRLRRFGITDLRLVPLVEVDEYLA